MSHLPKDGHRQFLLLTGLFQAQLGKRFSKNDHRRLGEPACSVTPSSGRICCPEANHIAYQSDHKTIHKKSNILSNLFPPKVVSEPDPATGHFNPFPSFNFAGSLRPVYPLSAKRTIPKTIPYPDYARDGIPRSEQKLFGQHSIKILNKEEQEGMRTVCRLAREVLDIAASELKPGVTTDYIDEVVHKACIEREVSWLQIGIGDLKGR